MSKKMFEIPFILKTAGSGGDGNVIGGGTGQGGSQAFPMSFAEWLGSAWAEDLIQNGVIDEMDFATWWEGNGFSREDWEELNPDLSWEDYFDD